MTLCPLTPAEREIIRKWTVNNLLARVALEMKGKRK